MNINEIAKRNYDANVKRGQITNRSEVIDFIKKTNEEIQELKESVWKNGINPFDPKEAADVILVQLSMMRHFGYNPEKILIEKVIYNENRED